MSSRVGWSIAAVLFIIFVAMSFYLFYLASFSRQVPVFMPLMVSGGNNEVPPAATPQPSVPDSPEPAKKRTDFELAGVETMTILHRAGRLGPTVSIEDFVRGLLFLIKQDGDHALTEKQKKELLPIIKNAYKKRLELLEIQSKIQRHESELPKIAKETAEKLTSSQIQRIRDSRDQVSILGFEDDYWQELMTLLEKR